MVEGQTQTNPSVSRLHVSVSMAGYIYRANLAANGEKRLKKKKVRGK